MVQAGNETVAALNNLVDLPITATSGIFMGVQTENPGELREALKRTSVNRMTTDESKAVISGFQGVTRSLATLEATGRAAGLVGLTRMAQANIPEAGDDPLTILRKYAEIRQIVDRSVQTVKASPGVSDEQKKLLDSIATQAEKAVPWTVKDINALQFNPSDEKVMDFARKVGTGGKAQATSSPPPPKPGEVQEGHRFKGGDPADPNNWEKVQ
jgi:hypothetical protein